MLRKVVLKLENVLLIYVSIASYKRPFRHFTTLRVERTHAWLIQGTSHATY